MEYKKFAEIIKSIRIERRLTQKEAARELTLSKVKYCRLENAIQEPNFTELQLLCHFYELDLTKMFEIKKYEGIRLYD